MPCTQLSSTRLKGCSLHSRSLKWKLRIGSHLSRPHALIPAVPCLKFVVQNTFNIGFAAFASFYGPEILSHSTLTVQKFTILLLSISDLWNEILLITNAFDPASIKNELRAMLVSRSHFPSSQLIF